MRNVKYGGIQCRILRTMELLCRSHVEGGNAAHFCLLQRAGIPEDYGAVAWIVDECGQPLADIHPSGGTSPCACERRNCVAAARTSWGRCREMSASDESWRCPAARWQAPPATPDFAQRGWRRAGHRNPGKRSRSWWTSPTCAIRPRSSSGHSQGRHRSGLPRP